MGDNGYWSWIWSCSFIAIGILLIVINHVIRFYIRKKKGLINPKENWKMLSMWGTICVAGIAALLIVPGIILMINSNVPATLSFNPFVGGTILLITGIGVLFATAIPLLYYVESR